MEHVGSHLEDLITNRITMALAYQELYVLVTADNDEKTANNLRDTKWLTEALCFLPYMIIY